MRFPPDPWKKLADLCHLHPEKDIPQCPWFLKFCYGEASVPKTSVVSESSTLNKENVSNIILSGKELDYTIARKYHTFLTYAAKKRIAEYSKLETVFW